MLKRLRRDLSSEAGFTLVELMLVVAVLGILAGIAVPRITGVRDEAALGALQSTASSIRNAMERERSIDGQYPDISNVTSITGDDNTALNFVLDNTDLSTGLDQNITINNVSIDQTADTFSMNISSPDAQSSITIDQGGIRTST